MCFTWESGLEPGDWATCLLFNQSFSLWTPRMPIPPMDPSIYAYMLHTSFCILLPRVCNFTALFTPQFVFAAARLRIAYTPRLPWLPILHLTFLPCLCCFGAAAALYANAAKYCERPRNSCPFSPYVSAGPTCIWYFFWQKFELHGRLQQRNQLKCQG